MLKNLDFSKNYNNRNENEIQSGNSISLIRASVFYKKQAKTKKVSVTIITEGRDKLRVTAVWYNCIISCLYLQNDDLLQEPDHVKQCTPVLDTIKTHKIVWSYTEKGVPWNKFSHLSNNKEIMLYNCKILIAVITKMKSMTTYAAIA